MISENKMTSVEYIRVSGVMVRMCVSNVVDLGFEWWLGQNKDYKIVIFCFPLRLAENQNNVSKWSHMFTHGLFFQ